MRRDFWVAGLPVAQGSTRSFAVKKGGRYTGRTVTTSTARGLAAWRSAINTAAQGEFSSIMTGAVDIQAEFVLPRPRSIPKSKQPRHTKKPDLDKLIRAVLDALTGVAFMDDSQVSSLTIWKRYQMDTSEQCGVNISASGE